MKWKEGDSVISPKLKNGMQKYIDISLCLNLALLDLNVILGDKEPQNRALEGLKSLIKQSDGMSVLIERFRSSNLIRHNLVSWPLANYTKYKGDLTEENLYSKMHGIHLIMIN